MARMLGLGQVGTRADMEQRELPINAVALEAEAGSLLIEARVFSGIDTCECSLLRDGQARWLAVTHANRRLLWRSERPLTREFDLAGILRLSPARQAEWSGSSASTTSAAVSNYDWPGDRAS